MAQVTLTVGGRRYDLKVRDGQEERFARLGGIVDETVRSLGAGSGVNEPRQLLMAALLLADRIGEEAPAPEPARAEDAGALAAQVVALAERLEKLAAALEKEGPPS